MSVVLSWFCSVCGRRGKLVATWTDQPSFEGRVRRDLGVRREDWEARKIALAVHL